MALVRNIRIKNEGLDGTKDLLLETLMKLDIEKASRMYFRVSKTVKDSVTYNIEKIEIVAKGEDMLLDVCKYNSGKIYVKVKTSDGYLEIEAKDDEAKEIERIIGDWFEDKILCGPTKRSYVIELSVHFY